jgi:hypothetical protein
MKAGFLELPDISGMFCSVVVNGGCAEADQAILLSDIDRGTGFERRAL